MPDRPILNRITQTRIAQKIVRPNVTIWIGFNVFVAFVPFLALMLLRRYGLTDNTISELVAGGELYVIALVLSLDTAGALLGFFISKQGTDGNYWGEIIFFLFFILCAGSAATLFILIKNSPSFSNTPTFSPQKLIDDSKILVGITITVGIVARAKIEQLPRVTQ